MKKQVYILFFLFSFANVFSQMDSRDTIWFDKLWGEVAREKAQYFRVYEKVKSSYIVYDKYLNGKTQMKAEATDYMPLIQDGLSIYYDENGLVTKKAHYKNDYLFGLETIYFDGGKDSSVYEHSTSENGKKTTTVIRKCASDKIEEEKRLDRAYTVVEEMPEYVGGLSELQTYLLSNITYPYEIKKANCGGKVFVKFIVNPNGEVSDVEVIKGTGFEALDNEAMRVVKDMPKWKPGKQNGQAVPVYFNLPINFTLNGIFYVFNSNNKNKNYIQSKGLLLKGSTDELITEMKNILDKDPNDVDAIYNLAVAYEMKNKHKKSCEYIRKSAELKHWLAEKKIDEWCK